MGGRYRLWVALLILTGMRITSAQDIMLLPTATPNIARQHYSYKHVTPVGIYEHEEICVSVFVPDLMEGDEARIHFREGTSSPLHMMPLGYNQTDGAFTVCIDERYHDNHSIQYYIELFPAGLTPIRIPEDPGAYNTVKIKKKASRYIEPILVGLLILSPALAAFLYTKIRKAHSKRRAEYETRLRARRRKLHKEREKHYKEYLKTLSGRKVPGPAQRNGGVSEEKPPKDSLPAPESQQEEELLEQPPKTEPARPKAKSASGPAKSGSAKPRMARADDTDLELKRELDNILNVIPVEQPKKPAPGTAKIPSGSKQPSGKPGPTKPAPARKAPAKSEPESPDLPVIDDEDDEHVEIFIE